MKTKSLVAIVLIMLITSCQNQEDQAKDNENGNAPIVTVVTSLKETYTPTLSYTGTVFANREANLGAALPGKVERILKKEGDRVKAGDLIVELSDEMLTQAEIENQALRKDYERVKRLRERESISQMDYDHLKAQLDASDAKVEMIRKNTRVFAPFSGTIVERMMEEGEIFFINPGLEPGYSMRSGIVRLMQLDPVRIEFDVNEKDLAYTKQGLNATITFDAIPNRTFQSNISNIKPMLSTLTRTATARISLPNKEGLLKPGIFARINVQLPEQDGVFVPMICISQLSGTAEEFVFVVDENNIAKRVIVNRIFTKGDMVAVTGVEPNQKIVAEGRNRVSHGQKVSISSNK